MKKYWLYALGELFLIVLGILLALYINNRNDHKKYKANVDQTVLNVYEELNTNIGQTRELIQNYYIKDSLIHLVMNDSLQASDYQNNFNLAYLILFYHSSDLQDEAYKNLMQLSNIDNTYQSELISKLKKLNLLKNAIEASDERMSSFVYEESLPLLAENVASFGDLTYKSQIKEDFIDYALHSSTYKAYVSQYAIIALKNQLKNNQDYLKLAYKIKGLIQDLYALNKEEHGLTTKVKSYVGTYYNTQFPDTMNIIHEKDSLYLKRGNEFKLRLIPLSEERFFTDNEGGGYFVNFTSPTDHATAIQLRLNYLATQLTYSQLKSD